MMIMTITLMKMIMMLINNMVAKKMLMMMTVKGDGSAGVAAVEVRR